MTNLWFLMLPLLLGTSPESIPNINEDGFVMGSPQILSMSKMAMGPNGILFLGDSKGAKVYALDLHDNTLNAKNNPLNVTNIDRKIAALIGRPKEAILIHDLVVNPISQNVYLTVSYGGDNKSELDIFDPNYINDATVLLRLSSSGSLEVVSLENIRYSVLAVSNSFSQKHKFRSGRSKNVYTIRYLNYYQGQLYISGLSNEEFSSTFRIAKFPFNNQHSTSGIEFYHGAHGQYETNSPINTFMPYKINGKDHLLAAYSCTPLITVPMEALHNGKKIRAKTVAEIGPGSHPIDIKKYQKNHQEFILMANSKRGLIRIDPNDLEKFKGHINYPTAKAGVRYTTLIPGSNIRQLDMLNDKYALLLVRTNDQSFHLESKATSEL